MCERRRLGGSLYRGGPNGRSSSQVWGFVSFLCLNRGSLSLIQLIYPSWARVLRESLSAVRVPCLCHRAAPAPVRGNGGRTEALPAILPVRRTKGRLRAWRSLLVLWRSKRKRKVWEAVAVCLCIYVYMFVGICTYFSSQSVACC